jgi:diguanylate cyclase (GGDEF)-like protein
MKSDDTIEIMLIEDDSGDVRLIRDILRKDSNAKFELLHCPTLSLAVERLETSVPDVIVLDLGLPDAVGLDVVRKARAAAPFAPLVVLTGREDETMGVQALHEGAQDYLTKKELDGRLLARTLRYAMERQRMQMVLRNESLLDALTGLYNRRGFMGLAENHLKASRRSGTPFGLVYVDLDGMKAVNDLYGHAEGDRALVEIATLLRGVAGPSDVIGRLGGDEFALLLAAVDFGTEGIIRARLQKPLALINAQSGRKYGHSFSIGVVIADPRSNRDLDQLLAQADSLMYEEKQQHHSRREPMRQE